jgi:hypothetical protein
MDVKRHNRQWLMRWTTSAGTGSPPSDDFPPGDLCARCDHGGVWITVPDIRPMPEARVVYTCRSCGTVTAHAELHVTARSIGD